MLDINILPLLNDNYAFLLTHVGERGALVIDPSVGPPVVEALEKKGHHPAAILLTHHHWDHVGGLPALLARWPSTPVLASSVDGQKIEGVTRFLKANEDLDLLGEPLRAIFVPGHTLGAVAFHFPKQAALFTGDTLFGAGCGRLFEGSPDQLYQSLQRLSDLPGATQVYCGHEYTASNLRFALSLVLETTVDDALLARAAQVDALRARGHPSLPFTLREEQATNPFLRSDRPAMQAVTGAQEPVQVFAVLRSMKDRFQG